MIFIVSHGRSNKKLEIFYDILKWHTFSGNEEEEKSKYFQQNAWKLPNIRSTLEVPEKRKEL